MKNIIKIILVLLIGFIGGIGFSLDNIKVNTVMTNGEQIEHGTVTFEVLKNNVSYYFE